MNSLNCYHIAIIIIYTLIYTIPPCMGDAPTRLVVSTDQSGTHSSIQQAIDAAANYSKTPIKILIKNGTYIGHVVIPMWKTNIFLQGQTMIGTKIMDRRSIADFGTADTATVVVEAEGFLAQDLTISNKAGAKAGQAVAFRSAGDRTVLHRCILEGYQDTLFTQRGRHFFRDTIIYGTVDFIFGDSQAVFQNSMLYFRSPVQGQSDVLTAQGRRYAANATGIVIQNCTLTADPMSPETPGGAYLGRPWKTYSRTVIMESFLDTVINPNGWLAWEHNTTSLLEVYYAEYNNRGPRKNTNDRLKCPGCKATLDRQEAQRFTVKNFIQGDQWIPATGVPFFSDLIS